MIDFHIHTDVSPDAKQSLGDAVARARQLGITHMAVTDHHELLTGGYYDSWKIKDLQSYSNAIKSYNDKYDDIYVAVGIEIGHVNRKAKEIKDVLDTIDFDFVISSAHFIDEVDPYFPEYFAGKPKHETYYNYLKEIRDSIDVMDDRVSVLGHIGYAARYSPYEDYKLRYEDFSEIIDEILLKTIKRGFGIELNTSNYGRKLDELMPPVSIVNRYRQLGGEIITIGSDSHTSADIGKAYNTARQIALDAGFKKVCVYKNLEPEFIDL